MNDLLAPWCQTKWILLSSGLFMIPSFLSYYKGLYLLSGLGFLTSIVSMNYWRKCCRGWRRNLDLYLSKLMCVVKLYYFIIYATKWTQYINYSIICSFAFISYLMANQNIKYWYLFHILFHIIIVYCGIKIIKLIY